MRKITGCCTICDKEIYEVLDRFPNKEPRRIGKPLDLIQRDYILTNGNRFTLSFCKECNPGPKEYPAMWRKIMNSFIYEQSKEFSELVGSVYITDGRHDSWMKELSKQSILGKFNG